LKHRILNGKTLVLVELRSLRQKQVNGTWQLLGALLTCSYRLLYSIGLLR